MVDKPELFDVFITVYSPMGKFSGNINDASLPKDAAKKFVKALQCNDVSFITLTTYSEDGEPTYVSIGKEVLQQSVFTSEIISDVK